MTKQRLSKVLAERGIASRRHCEVLIQEGGVTVNEKVVLVPQTMVDPLVDRIRVNGDAVKEHETKVYFMVNKPLGYVCTSAPNVKKRVIDLVPIQGKRLFTVGRLDKDTTGLILLTNDGQVAHRLMHPSFEIEKEYVAKVNHEITHDHLVTISQGRFIENSYIKPLAVKKVRKGTLKIVVHDGKKHEVRLLLQKAGLEVIELKRVRIGGLVLGELPLGARKEIKGNLLEIVTGKDVL